MANIGWSPGGGGRVAGYTAKRIGDTSSEAFAAFAKAQGAPPPPPSNTTPVATPSGGSGTTPTQEFQQFVKSSTPPAPSRSSTIVRATPATPVTHGVSLNTLPSGQQATPQPVPARGPINSGIIRPGARMIMQAQATGAMQPTQTVTMTLSPPATSPASNASTAVLSDASPAAAPVPVYVVMPNGPDMTDPSTEVGGSTSSGAQPVINIPAPIVTVVPPTAPTSSSASDTGKTIAVGVIVATGAFVVKEIIGALTGLGRAKNPRKRTSGKRKGRR